MISSAFTLSISTYVPTLRHHLACAADGPSTKQENITELRDGTHVVYELTSAPSRGPVGRPAVFLHDFMTDRRLFAPQFRQQATGSLQKHRRCLRYDMRGFGGTIGDIDVESGYSHVEDLIEVLYNVGLGEEMIHLVGCGMGGSIALDVAFKYPKRIVSVACVCSGLEGHRWARHHFLEIGNNSHEMMDGWKQEWMRFNTAWSIVRNMPESLVAKNLMEMAETYKGQHFLKPSNFNRIHDLPTFRRLGEIYVPVLAVDGKGDTPQFRKINDEIFEGVQNPVLDQAQVVPDATHWITLEQPVVLKGLLEKLWKDTEARHTDLCRDAEEAIGTVTKKKL